MNLNFTCKIIVLFLVSACLTADAFEADEGAAITFDQALVNVPANRFTSNCYGTMDNPEVAKCLKETPSASNGVVVIFLHGCDGMNLEATDKMRDLGYLYVAPKSFRRPGRKQDCLIQSDKKTILKQRMAEAKYTVQKLKATLKDKSLKYALVGFSEGASSTALYPDDDFDAKVILGWSCHASDPWWNGIRGSKNIPALAVVGSQDKYHQNPSNAGNCGTFTNQKPNSESVVLENQPHDILTQEVTWSKVTSFLQKLGQQQSKPRISNWSSPTTNK